MEELEIKMRVIQRYKNAFERQIGESIWINHHLKEGTKLLNSKNEYNRCSIPRLGLMISKDDIIEDYKEGQRERELRREINRLREEIRRGNKEETHKSKKLKLADVCREIIQENQFEWATKRLNYKKEREKREKEEEMLNTKVRNNDYKR